MTEKLHSIIRINETDYEVVAETAKKVANALTINVVNGTTETYTYDGSTAPEITINAVEDAGHAGVAKKVENKLTINVINGGVTTPVEFDGSEAKTIDIDVGDANKIQVNLDNDQKAYATITIRANDPVGGDVGDIWFKY